MNKRIEQAEPAPNLSYLIDNRFILSKKEYLADSDSKYTTSQILQAIFQSAIQLESPIAIWQLPNDSLIKAVCNISKSKTHDILDLESSQAGFVLSPFHRQNETDTTFIKADIIFNSKDCTFEILNNKCEQLLEIFFSTLKTHLANPTAQNRYFKNDKMPIFLKNQPTENFDRNAQFKSLVQKGIKAIREGHFEKIVLSKAQLFRLTLGFNVVNSFMRLTKEYPNAFVSLVSVPTFGTWMGATPELLLGVDQHRILKTVSMAGTNVIRENIKLSDTPWTQKEIEEQAFVTRYITDQFKKIGLNEFLEHGPQTVRAGQLAHLKTLFEVDLNKIDSPKLMTNILNHLHPTPAVCGMPRESARDFILQNEPHDREFYSGFLGPVNVHNETHLYVNLRCIQLFEKYAVIYAGAGITKDSDPEKELNETNLKYETILKCVI